MKEEVKLEPYEEYLYALSGDDLIAKSKALDDADRFVQTMPDRFERNMILQALADLTIYRREETMVKAIGCYSKAVAMDGDAKVKSSDGDIESAICILKDRVIEARENKVSHAALEGLALIHKTKPQADRLLFDAYYQISRESNKDFVRQAAKCALKEQFGMPWRPRLVAYKTADFVHQYTGG